MWCTVFMAVATAGPNGAFWTPADSVSLSDLEQVAGSPSGTVVAAASAERVLTIDALTGEIVAVVDLEDGSLQHLVVTDGRWLALAWQGGITIHQEDGREFLRVGGYTGRVTGLALAADHQHVALATDLGVFLHAVPSGSLVWSSTEVSGRVAFHPAGTQVYSATRSANVVLDRATGAELAHFGMASDRFVWSSDVLWTATDMEAPRPYARGTLTPLDPLIEPQTEVWAVDPAGHVVLDGCRLTLATGERWCIPVDVYGVAVAADGGVWWGTGDGLERWQPLPEGMATRAGGQGGAAVAIGVGPEGHVVEAGDDGLVTVRDPDGAPLWGAQPTCAATPCTPLSVGVAGAEVWWLSPSGQAWAWTLAGGAATLQDVATGATAGGRMQDGRWAVLAGGKVRVSGKPGKGSGPKVAGEQLVVGPKGYASGAETRWFDADGEPSAALRLGPGRTAVHVALAADNSSLALVDDQGSVHRYRADGTAAFRRPGLDPIGSLTVLTDGTPVLAEARSLRFLDPEDGSDTLRIVLAGEGPAALAGRDRAVVAWHAAEGTAVWRIDPSALTSVPGAIEPPISAVGD